MNKGSWIALFAVVILASCHTKKKYLQTNNNISSNTTVDKPQLSLVEKYAEIMRVNKMDIKNSALYAFIDEWLGTPYKFGGQDKNGIDCSGFAQLLEKQAFGISIPRSTSDQVNVIKRKYEEELVEGDLVFFDYDGRKFGHVGVYLQNGYVVHASTSKGVIIVQLHDPYMYQHFTRAGSVNVEILSIKE
jgi:lipoprotein Spr/probable lipoprotein NlpC